MKWYNEILTALKGFFSLEHDATEQEVHQRITGMKTLDEMKQSIEAEIRPRIEQEEGERYGAQIAAEAARADAAETKAGDLETRLAEADKQLESLQADVKRLEAQAVELRDKIAALEKLPAADHTSGQPATGTQSATDKPYLRNPVYLKAQQMRARMAAN